MVRDEPTSAIVLITIITLIIFSFLKILLSLFFICYLLYDDDNIFAIMNEYGNC